MIKLNSEQRLFIALLREQTLWANERSDLLKLPCYDPIKISNRISVIDKRLKQIIDRVGNG